MFAAALIPDFSLQAVLRRDPELRARPVALVDPALPKTAIIQLTSPARAQGVVEGLTASQALARCGELTIKTRSPAQEQAAADVLLQTAYAFSPRIEATAPGICTMELKGLGLETDTAMETWAGRMLRALASLGLDARVGIATTPALALLAARTAEPYRVVRHSSTFVSALPIDMLELGADMREILERWGIRSIGALIALDKSDLAERLGPAAVELLDRISPAAVRPLKLVVPPETFEEQMDFDREIETAEPLLFVLRRFIEQLARRVDVIHLVMAELHLRLGLSSGAVYERVFKIPAPTSSVDTLFRMLQTHLDTVRTDAPITSLRLEARPCRPDLHQFGLFETTLKDPNQFAETLARLAALCGPDRVGTPVPEATHRPDAFRMKAPDWGTTDSNANLRLADDLSAEPPRSLSADRVLFPPHEPVGADVRRREGIRSPKSPPYVGAYKGRQTPVQGFNARINRGILSSRVGGNGSPLVAKRERLKNSAEKSLLPFPGEGKVCGPALRRFRPPLTAVVEFRNERPIWLHSSIFNGALGETRGPFVSSGDWWDRNPWAREEWDASAADGAIYRICRAEDGCFVEGIYD